MRKSPSPERKRVFVGKKLYGEGGHVVIPTANVDYMITNCSSGPGREAGLLIRMKSGEKVWVEWHGKDDIAHLVQQLQDLEF